MLGKPLCPTWPQSTYTQPESVPDSFNTHGRDELAEPPRWGRPWRGQWGTTCGPMPRFCSKPRRRPLLPLHTQTHQSLNPPFARDAAPRLPMTPSWRTLAVLEPFIGWCSFILHWQVFPFTPSFLSPLEYAFLIKTTQAANSSPTSSPICNPSWPLSSYKTSINIMIIHLVAEYQITSLSPKSLESFRLEVPLPSCTHQRIS